MPGGKRPGVGWGSGGCTDCAGVRASDCCPCLPPLLARCRGAGGCDPARKGLAAAEATDIAGAGLDAGLFVRGHRVGQVSRYHQSKTKVNIQVVYPTPLGHHIPHHPVPDQQDPGCAPVAGRGFSGQRARGDDPPGWRPPSHRARGCRMGRLLRRTRRRGGGAGPTSRPGARGVLGAAPHAGHQPVRPGAAGPPAGGAASLERLCAAYALLPRLARDMVRHQAGDP